MAAAEPILTIPVAAIARTNLTEFLRFCAARLDAGDRLLTLFGRADDADGVVVTAVLLGVEGKL